MKSVRIIGSEDGRQCRRAIAVFAGWAMDARPFMSLRRDGYDIIVIHDYREDTLDAELWRDYDEIVVFGWSMGVVYGEEFMRLNPGLPVTRSVAVNGSPCPRHDEIGIPVAVYDLTAAISTPRQLSKFYMRVCGGASEMARYMPEIPLREVPDAVDELHAITRKVEDSETYDPGLWDEIWLSSRDLIFPIDNLRKAWASEGERVTITDRWGHFPDFQWLFDRMAVDKSLVESRFSDSMPTYGENASVQESVARDLVAMLTPVEDCDLLEIGVGSGYLTRLYQESVKDSRIVAIDLVGSAPVPFNGNTLEMLVDDAELAVRSMASESYDLVLSSSTVQWFNSPRRFLKEVVRILRPGGTALISVYGRGTFSCLRDIAPEASLHYAPIDSSLLDDSGVEWNISKKRYELEFPSPREAIDHLRLTGVNATRRSPLPVGKTRRLLEALRRTDGTASLDFEVQFIRIRKLS